MKRTGKYKTVFLIGAYLLLIHPMFSQKELTPSEAQAQRITPSKIYAQYANVPNIIAMEVQNLPIDSIHKVTITLLVTEDSAMMERLRVDFKIRASFFNDTVLGSDIITKTLYRNKENIAEKPSMRNGKIDFSKSCILIPVKFPHQMRLMVINSNFDANVRIEFDFLMQKIEKAIALAKKNKDNIIIIQN